jgi:TM2 domain-containing membrane protein YozV
MSKMARRNNSMVAAALEVGPGALLQTFGIGHLYQGRVKAGLAFMFSYWILQTINGLLIGFGGLGVITGVLTWLAYMVIAPTDVLKS